ncbi:MAG: glycosyltransferase [Acholeplasma sp.]|nr:glycosyltransferase [Acholeplasma sp.]
MKRIVIINPFSSYKIRQDFFLKYYHDKGYTVKIITTDYNHLQKKTVDNKDFSYTYIKTIPYSKNLSLKRLVSHVKFAKNVVSSLDYEEYDLIHCIFPPNILVKLIAKDAKKKNIPVIFDVMDMWPESLPIIKFKNNVLFSFWKNLRNKHIDTSKLVITECDLFKNSIKSINHNLNVSTIYLHKSELVEISPINKSVKDKIVLTYLGSVNNLIDIQDIVKLIIGISKYKPVVIQIIGGGEKLDKLSDQLKDKNIEVIITGFVFDQNEIKEYFSKTHFGINLMKSSVFVGMTMKSIDYFRHSIPIISNIVSDTSNLINEYSCGFNISNKNIQNVINEIGLLNDNEYNKMVCNVRQMFIEQLSYERLTSKMDSCLKKLIN